MPSPNAHPVQTREAPEKPAPHEPSMEDILASIRRIIAADQTGVRAGFVPPTLEPVGGGAGPAYEPPQVSAADHHDSDTAARPVAYPEWASAAHVDDATLVSEGDAPPLMAASSQHDDLDHHHGVSSDEHGPEDASATDDIYDLSDAQAIDPSDLVEPLISSAAGASISSSFQTLAQTVLLNDPKMVERLTREALRPMLKAWLDENLPSMVERLVRSEIERVARGGRHRD